MKPIMTRRSDHERRQRDRRKARDRRCLDLIEVKEITLEEFMAWTLRRRRQGTGG